MPKQPKTSALSNKNIPENKVDSLDFQYAIRNGELGLAAFDTQRIPKEDTQAVDAETFGRQSTGRAQASKPVIGDSPPPARRPHYVTALLHHPE